MTRERDHASRRTRELDERIRKANLRATPARLAVFALLDSASRPMSHAETVAQLHSNAGDDATVFRALTDLTRVGLLRRIDVGDRMWRFEPDRHDMVSHPHFVCVKCGSISCLFDVVFTLPTAGVPKSIKKKAVQVLLRGRCNDCEAPQPSPTPEVLARGSQQ